jgi:hypothetical protein
LPSSTAGDGLNLESVLQKGERLWPGPFCEGAHSAGNSDSIYFRSDCIHPVSLSITHISDGAFALIESFVILFVTPIRGGVTDERGEGSQYIRLA